MNQTEKRSKYCDRYGIPGQDVYNLRQRWHRHVKDDTDWESFDSFLFWASVSGYGKGKNLKRHREGEPHGPGNSYWYSFEEDARKKQDAYQDRRDMTSHFCQGCTKKCPIQRNGCKAYRDWYVKNWNENIHVPKATPEVKPQKTVREKFQYEHPDLQREGIVWGEDPCETCVRLSECDGVDEDCPRRKK